MFHPKPVADVPGITPLNVGGGRVSVSFKLSSFFKVESKLARGSNKLD
jgi:hypothetical protein